MDDHLPDHDPNIAQSQVYELRSRSVPRPKPQKMQIQPPQQVQTSILLSLPAEIRVLIFTYLFRTQDMFLETVKTSARPNALHTHKAARYQWRIIGLLHTCRQLYHEVIPILLANMTFILSDEEHIFRNLSVRRCGFLSSIRYFKLVEDAIPFEDLFDNLKLDQMRSLKRLEIYMSVFISYDLTPRRGSAYKRIERDQKERHAILAAEEWEDSYHSAKKYWRSIKFYYPDRKQYVKDCISDARRTFTVAIRHLVLFEEIYDAAWLEWYGPNINVTSTFEPGDVEAEVELEDPESSCADLDPALWAYDYDLEN